MTDDEMIVVRNKYTGAEYAYARSKFSEMPTCRIEDGSPGQASFGREDLVRMVECGSANVVGSARLSLVIKYDDKPE